MAIQWRGAAFRGEFGGSADEPAHYITGLMVHDYLAAGLPSGPLEYARSYYRHYPKVALGHWPPLFYVVQAVWELVFGPSRVSLMILMAVIAAALATVLCDWASREYSLGAGICLAVLLVTHPAIAEYSRMVMAETLMALLVLLAVLAWGSYLETERWQAAAWFGLWSTLALLTKGTGIALALVPPLSVLLSRRWRLVSRFSFWLPAIPVVAFAGPWYLLAPDAQHESVARFGGLQFIGSRILGTLAGWQRMLGVVPVLAGMAGMLLWGIRIRRGAPGARWLAGACILASAYICRLLVGAWEERHLLTTLPVLFMFAWAPVAWLFSVPLKSLHQRMKSILAGAVTTVVAAANIYALPPTPQFGFAEVAQHLASSAPLRDEVFLICSDASGEGMFISEVAMREKRPGHVILRASKVLASMDFMGWRYRSLFDGQESVLRYLESVPVGIVIIDDAARERPHGNLLAKSMRDHPEKWELELRYPPSRPASRQYGEILVYRSAGLPPPLTRRSE
ncbi:MAG: glycosyltransferase family 39 protein [Bryobacteraceae bacterium]